MKKLIFLIFLFFGLAVTPVNAQADLTVTCPPAEGVNTCTVTPASTPLFNETNWAPGDFTTKTFEVINQDLEDSCNLTLDTSNESQTPSNFASQLSSQIGSFFLGTLQNLFSAGQISLGTVPATSTASYSWQVQFDPNAGNEFQNAVAEFDFDLNFVCNPVSTSGGGGSVQGASAPVCNSTVPSSTPFLTVTRAGANSALLNWTAVTPVTHYMIRYGTTPGNYIYGATNVGNVTNFTVNFLSANTTYYFQVAGVNNCMPGPWSNEVSTRPTGVVLPPGPAQGFVEGTLGVATESSPSPSPTPTSSPTVEAGQVAAASTCTEPYYPWWIPLVIQIAVSFMYIWKRWRDRFWIIVVALLAIISQIVHEILGCNCGTDGLCPWYWLLNLIIVMVVIFYRTYQTKAVEEKKTSKK